MYLTCLYKCIFIQHYKPRAARLHIKPEWQTVHTNQTYKLILNNYKHTFNHTDEPYSVLRDRVPLQTTFLEA